MALTDEWIDSLYINGTKHWIGKREIAHAIENEACAERDALIAELKRQLAEARKDTVSAWQQGYDQGVIDERISEANIGIAGFGAKVNPARQNPYNQQDNPQLISDVREHVAIDGAVKRTCPYCELDWYEEEEATQPAPKSKPLPLSNEQKIEIIETHSGYGGDDFLAVISAVERYYRIGD